MNTNSMFKAINIRKYFIDCVYDVEYKYMGYHLGYWDGENSFRMDNRNDREVLNWGVIGLIPILKVNLTVRFYAI